MARAEVGRLGDAGEDRIIIETQWNERELIKQLPGVRWDPVAKVWHGNLTWTLCIQLRGVFREELTVGPRLTEWAWKQKTRVDRLLKMRALIAPPSTLDGDKLYPFQRVGADFLRLGSEVLLADEMGTGKTIQALAALDELRAYPALVVCPNSVKTHWHSEVMKWTEFGAPFVVTGGAAGRAKILAEAAKHPYAVVIVNIESVRLLSRLSSYGSTRLRRCRECDKKNGEATIRPAQCEVHPKPLNQIPFKTVIIDEAHRIKNPQSKQTRAVWAVAHGGSVRNRWALTGTPLANHPGDLWSIFHAISPRDFPTKSHFVDRYCLQSWNAFGGLDIVGINPANRDEFFALLDPRFRRMPKALVLRQLPEKVRSVRLVEMTPAQARVYKQLEDTLASVLPDGRVLEAANPLVSRMRRMQVASSMVELTLPPDAQDIADWVVRLVEPSPKVDELEVIYEEMGGRPFVVAAEQRQLIELASRRFTKVGIPHGLITGKIPEFERHITLEQFQAGKLPVLLFTLKAGGTGLTMTAADTIVFLQRSDSMIDNKQGEDRVHRIGSERHESIHVIDVVTRDTVEEGQILRLHEKLMRLEEITRDRAALAADAQNDPIGYHDWDVRLDDEEAAILEMRI